MKIEIDQDENQAGAGNQSYLTQEQHFDYSSMESELPQEQIETEDIEEQIEVNIEAEEVAESSIGVEKDVDERSDGVLITAHHQIRETDKVVRRNLFSGKWKLEEY